MSTDSLSNTQGNFQELRNMWNSKAQEQQKPLRSTSSLEQRQEQKKSPRNTIPTLKITNKTSSIPTIKHDLPSSSNNERITIFESVEILPPIEEHISLPMPPPPPSIFLQHQAQSIATLKQTVNKMMPEQSKNIFHKNPKNTGIHRWHITSHVFRSGLIFNRTRRASDSILPLLMKTQKANYRPRTDSLENTLDQTPFQCLIDYVTHNQDHDKDSLTVPTKMKRSTSDTSDCIRQNRLDDSIFQYEMILRHLKNYEQFMSTYPTSKSMASKKREQPFESELNTSEAKFLARTSIPNRQTQSLSRNVGRTFAEFIMNDLFSSTSSSLSSKSLTKEQRRIIYDASSQTDSSEPAQEITTQTNNSNELTPPAPVELERNNSVTTEEAKIVLNELDTMLDNSSQQPSIAPNSEINVVVVNPPAPPIEPKILPPAPKPLMQRLFEGKKTAYSPSDLNMQSTRLSPEMIPTYEAAKKKCFFDSEQGVYAANMIKISRRGYTQHVRLLCITTERVYNITKRDPYPKEGLLFANILGVTCTPYKDGFVCIHTKETHDDRGDWLIVVDHPCEFITQLFMVLKRNNNDDRFLKISNKFTHCRRCFGEACSNDCSIEARLSDTFLVKKADFDAVIIYTP